MNQHAVGEGTALSAPIYRRNLRWLSRFYPNYLDIVEAYDSKPTYELGSVGAVLSCRDRSGKWIHGPDDPWHQAQGEAERCVVADPSLYVVVRPGLGYQAFAILERLEKSSPESIIVVVEDRLELFRTAMLVADWTPVFESERVVLILGKPETALRRLFEAHRALMLLPLTLVAPEEFAESPSCRELQSILSKLANDVRASAEWELSLAGQTIEERRSRGEPMRVVLAGEDFGYLTTSIADGFRACGCEVEISAKNSQLPRAFGKHEWVSHILRLVPDVVVWMNRPGLSHLGSTALRQLCIENVVWAVDNPRRMKLSQADLASIDLFCCFDHTQLSEFQGIVTTRAAQVSVACGIHPLPRSSPSSSGWPSREGPNVSFVGSLGNYRIASLREVLSERDPLELSLLEELSGSDGDAAAIFESRTGRPFEGGPCFYVEEARASRKRVAALSRLSGAGLQIYGAIEWADAPEVLARCYAGPVKYGYDLASVYYNSKINLNIFHEQCLDSTNSRVYDVLAAGGFLLTEDRPSLHREFDVGTHLVTFSSLEEAEDKVTYYLAHHSEAEDIARAGQRHVLTHHTYLQRCADILARLGVKVSDGAGSSTPRCLEASQLGACG